MEIDFRECLTTLRERALIPESCQAVYAGGSLVRGWGNESSDLDIYVIVTEPWVSDTAQLDTAHLTPDSIPVETFYVDRRRWDVEYWLESQVDQLFAKVGADQLDGTQPAGKRMNNAEIAFLHRLGHAARIAGDDWVLERQRRLEASALRTVMVLRALHTLDIYTEDAVGQLKAGDVESSVLSAKLAWRHAIDALLSSHGEYGESPKWFARRFRAARPTELSFEEFWAIETMRSFDPAAPGKWVEEVLTACQDISLEVGL